MKRSTERILTTHTGSLPRPDDLVEMLRQKEEAQAVDQAEFDAHVRAAVGDVVARQVDAGVDVLNDGEQGKPSFSLYIKDRLTGFEGQSFTNVSGESRDFPEYTARRYAATSMKRPACTGPITWKDRRAVQNDIESFKAALQEVKPEEVFMTAASPGIVAQSLKDDYYGSEEAYVYALAEVLKEEYDAIHRAGFLLQVDCPDLAMDRHIRFADRPVEDFRKNAELHVEALGYALRDIPPDRLRLHLCWGNNEGPHHLDVPLIDIIDIALKARPAALSFEGANPRHEHEWKVFQQVRLPEGKALIPGVLDSTTNFIEHPELVAQRIVPYARLVGRENVIAGTDCGFATFFTPSPVVDPRIAWAKLQAMAEGARLASEELW